MANNKERLLFLLKNLMDNTDEAHEYTMKELVCLYRENGMAATTKTIRNDIDTLRDSGFGVIETSDPGKPTYYSYEQKFNSAELKMIIDAVAAARFISPKDCQELTGRLLTLAGRNIARELAADVDFSTHNETPNRNLYVTIQEISEAISMGKKISYQYYDYNLDKEKILHNNGEVYTYSPYGFAWNTDRYYLLGQVDKRPGIINPVRVDLLCRVRILEEDAAPAPSDFHPERYSQKVFTMFGGEETEVVLEADNSLVKKFIDRFGSGFAISKASDDTFYATVRVSVSPTFFGWVFQYNGKIRIVGPDAVSGRYMEMLRRASAYENAVHGGKIPDPGRQQADK